jgi:hypothetical protein
MQRQRINRYHTYWNDIAPRSHQEYYERWLFAYMSIRTMWRENVKLFEAIRAMPMGFTEDQLRQCLLDNRSGMINRRTAGVWKFHHDFWSNPTSWYPALCEPVSLCRDRLVERIYGMGIAKVSFVMEMAFPTTCDVVCIDVHIGRLYGLKNTYERKMNLGAYRRIEEHWTRHCQERDIPSAIARHVYWDHVQGQKSTSYWSHVFERAA